MNTEEKAVAQLKSNGVSAHIENDTVYIAIGDDQFEIAEFEINYQAKIYDENNTPELKRFKVKAKVVTYCYTEVEATSKEEAWLLAKEEDGGNFITDDDEGYFELENEDEIKEI